MLKLIVVGTRKRTESSTPTGILPWSAVTGAIVGVAVVKGTLQVAAAFVVAARGPSHDERVLSRFAGAKVRRVDA